MVIQYPHIGKAILPANATETNGDFEAGVGTINYETICRIEPNKGSQYIYGTDNNKITFFGIVYMPLNITAGFEIKPGTLFEVWEGERLITKRPVLQFSKGQLNMRIWL